MKIIAVIPARYQASRFPGKLMQKLGDNSVIATTYQNVDRIAEAIQNIDCDIIVNVQGDEPFLKANPLKQLISVFYDDVNEEISLASLKIKLKNQEEIQSPNNVKVITDINGIALYFISFLQTCPKYLLSKVPGFFDKTK